MNRIKKSMYVVVTLLLMITLTGCGKVATLKNGEEAVVQFGKESISANDLYDKLKENMDTKILVNLMDEKIIGSKYETTSSMKKTAEKQIDQLKSLYGSGVSQAYTYSGYADEEDMRSSLILDQKRKVAVKDYLKKKVTDKEINKYYKNNIYGDVKASHILIAPDTTDDMSDKEKAEAKKEALTKANEVITKLKNGENFEDLAKEYSDDETVDLGWFNDGDMEDSFFQATLKLQKNKYTTTPVETSYGYHIILKTGEKEKAALKEVKDKIEENIVKEKLEKDVALEYNTLMSVREEAGMKFSDDTMKRKYKAYMTNLIAQAREKAASESSSN